MSEKPPKKKKRKVEDLTPDEQKETISEATDSGKRYGLHLLDLPSQIIAMLGGYANRASDVSSFLQTTKNPKLTAALKDNNAWFPLYLRKYGLWDVWRFSKPDGSRDERAEAAARSEATEALGRVLRDDVATLPENEGEAKRKLWYWGYQRRKKLGRIVAREWAAQNLKVEVDFSGFTDMHEEVPIISSSGVGSGNPFLSYSGAKQWRQARPGTPSGVSEPWDDPLWTPIVRSPLTRVTGPSLDARLLAAVPIRGNRLFLWHAYRPREELGIFRMLSWNRAGKLVSAEEFWVSPRNVFEDRWTHAADLLWKGRARILYDAERNVLAFVAMKVGAWNPNLIVWDVREVSVERDLLRKGNRAVTAILQGIGPGGIPCPNPKFQRLEVGRLHHRFI